MAGAGAGAELAEEDEDEEDAEGAAFEEVWEDGSADVLDEREVVEAALSALLSASEEDAACFEGENMTQDDSAAFASAGRGGVLGGGGGGGLLDVGVYTTVTAGAGSAEREEDRGDEAEGGGAGAASFHVPRSSSMTLKRDAEDDFLPGVALPPGWAAGEGARRRYCQIASSSSTRSGK